MTATDNHNTALAIPSQRTTLQVDDSEAASKAAQLMKHAGTALFPRDMTLGQATQLARVALAYGLDPMLGELILLHGVLYIGIDGRMRKANEHPAYDGLEINPATDAERKSFRCAENEHLWVCRVWRKDRRLPAVNYGRAGGAAEENPIAKKWAQELAQKRAKHRALKDAFSMPIPSLEEREDWSAQEEARVWAPTDGPVIEGDARVIEPLTGEIVDSGPAEIRRDQVTAIHTLASVLAWDDDEYRAVLQDTFHVASSTELTEAQASALLEMLANQQDPVTIRLRKHAAENAAFLAEQDAATAAMDAAHPELVEKRSHAKEILRAGKDVDPIEEAVKSRTKQAPPPAPIAASPEALEEYGNLVDLATRLGEDPARWEIVDAVSAEQLTEMQTRLERAIAVLQGQGSLAI